MKYLSFILFFGLIGLVSCSKDDTTIVEVPNASLIVVNSESDFNSKVQSGVSLAYFHSKGCSICATQRPKVTALTSESEISTAKLLEVDFESNPSIVSKNGVFGFPTILIFKDGVKVQTLNGGGHSTQKLKDIIKALL